MTKTYLIYFNWRSTVQNVRKPMSCLHNTILWKVVFVNGGGGGVRKVSQSQRNITIPRINLQLFVFYYLASPDRYDFLWDVLELPKLSTPHTPEQNSHHVLNDVYNMNLNKSVNSAIWRDREGGTGNKNSTEERALFFPVSGIGLPLSTTANTRVMATSLPSLTVCVAGRDFPLLASKGDGWGWSRFQRQK